MAAVNYGPVVTLIRDWRPAGYTHNHILSQLNRGKAICSLANYRAGGNTKATSTAKFKNVSFPLHVGISVKHVAFFTPTNE